MDDSRPWDTTFHQPGGHPLGCNRTLGFPESSRNPSSRSTNPTLTSSLQSGLPFGPCPTVGHGRKSSPDGDRTSPATSSSPSLLLPEPHVDY